MTCQKKYLQEKHRLLVVLIPVLLYEMAVGTAVLP